EREAGKREAACHIVDDVHLTGIQARPERVGRHLELKQRGTPIGRIEIRALDEWCLEDLDGPAIEREARLQERRTARRRLRLIHLVVEVPLLIPIDDMREAREELDAFANERIVRALLSRCRPDLRA